MRLFQRILRQSAYIEIKVSGQVGKSQFVVFKDGAVVIETPKRLHRFDNTQELVSRAKSLRSADSRPFLRIV